MTKGKWVVTGVAIPTVLGLVGLGFAAMSTNPPFIVATWVPILFFVLGGLVTLALIAYLTMWNLIMRVRFQQPIILIGQHGETKIVPKATSAMRPPPRRLEHDGVLWEDGGRNSWGNMSVIGPLCPKDYTPLATKHNDKIEVNVDYDTLISDSGYHSILVCPECKAEYTLGASPKQIKDSRLEVGSRFEGKRRREQQT